MKRITQRHCFILNLRFDVFSASLNLKIKEQPSDIVSERKETFAICLFLSSSWCREGKVVQTLLWLAKHISVCQISLRDFVLCFRRSPPGRWTSVMFNPQKLLMLANRPRAVC